MKVKNMTIKEGERVNLSQFPIFSVTGSIKGMKKLYYGKDALLIRCGKWIYNVSSQPQIYNSIT